MFSGRVFLDKKLSDNLSVINNYLKCSLLAQSASERLKNAQAGERGRLISALGAEQASDKFFITCLIMVEVLVKESQRA